ncbi:hypothetical protein SCORR_v1c09600 [Spiroplasma corruscae]|uniref:Uncharacterized protein n=1 Tax=Spiroplasma corruscae TaxID=216934 RepID=A0A222EQF8_9MOLU|nr:hypothetical protein [Spiroplasma corruscae]ASP28732.1 hypothetical protein SCORR_v1c09600 [Spiroplasma corruscae]
MDIKLEISNKVKKASIFKMAFIFILLLIPSFLFISILIINDSFNQYRIYYDTLQDYFQSYDLPKYNTIITLVWFSIALYMFIILIIFFIPRILNKKISIKLKHLIIFIIALLLVICFIVFSVGEYNYSRFYQMYAFVANTDIYTDNNSLEKIVSIFKKNYSNRLIYGWTTDTMTWWLCLIKVIITIIYFSFFSNKLEIRKQKINYVKKDFGQEKLSSALSKLTLNNKKNISFWILLSALAVFIPHFIYVVAISLTNSSLNSMLSWTFIGLELLNKKDLFDNTSQFAIKSLPIIISGFMIATICVLSVLYIKKDAINYKFLMIQFIILFIEVILLIGVNFFSMHELNNIYNFWKSNDQSEIIKSNNYLYQIYGSAFLNSDGTVKDFFLYGIKYVSHGIITFSLFITSYIIIGTKLLKNYKESQNESKNDYI